MKILITGGAGFVGSELAKAFKSKGSTYQVDVFDNLKRRGSERNIQSLTRLGVGFFHGDLRHASDLSDLNRNYDLLIDAAAEPSVLAGVGSSPAYVLHTNLLGTLNCLEFARQHAPRVIFLSTSRVYSLTALQAIPLTERETRLEIKKSAGTVIHSNATAAQVGFSEKGINEYFSCHKARSFYGFTKLASEYALQEYAAQYGLKAIINRCGVIAGPGQFGKVDQGVFTLWLARHYFKGTLMYHGYGGRGKQVRDLLHPGDLFSLLETQLEESNDWECETFNVGGGHQHSVSLAEFTNLCRDITGNKVSIDSQPETHGVDVPYYVSDNSKVEARYKWKPQITPNQIVAQTFEWIRANESALKEVFAP